jgi:hypothetical protein
MRWTSTPTDPSRRTLHADVGDSISASRTRYPSAGHPGGCWRAAARLIAAHRGVSAVSSCAPWIPPFLAPRVDRTSCTTHRAVPAGAALRCVLLRLRNGAPHALPLRRLGALDGALVVASRGADDRTLPDVGRGSLAPFARPTAAPGLRVSRPAHRAARRAGQRWCAPDGIDFRRWPTAATSGVPGSLRRTSGDWSKKGIAQVLAALRLLGVAGRAGIGCSGWPLRSLRRAPRRPGIADRVRFAGRQDPGRRCARTAAADVLVAAA